MESRIEFKRKNKYKIDYVTFVNVTRNSGFVFPKREGKPCHSIIFVESGEIEYHFLESDEKHLFRGGDVIFIPRKYPYIARYTKDGTINNVITFTIDDDHNIPSLSNPFFTKNKEVSRIMSSMKNGYVNNIFFLVSKTYEVLYNLVEKASPVPQKFRKLSPAIDEIQKSYFENKKISFYSSLCDMSESNFRKLFREFTGKSFVEYRNTIRINEAKKLIESNECTVSEAAYLTGFNNMSFFYECMRKYK
ncbi:MAG: helix-turn-helix domain-containing protein [Clostridia bacterium]|nr:helix-turn-helix domain-containing protein [Clostridia bacterium]